MRWSKARRGHTRAARRGGDFTGGLYLGRRRNGSSSARRPSDALVRVLFESLPRTNEVSCGQVPFGVQVPACLGISEGGQHHPPLLLHARPQSTPRVFLPTPRRFANSTCISPPARSAKSRFRSAPRFLAQLECSGDVDAEFVVNAWCCGEVLFFATLFFFWGVYQARPK